MPLSSDAQEPMHDSTRTKFICTEEEISEAIRNKKPLYCLEPVSKSSEEDNEAGELDKAEEVRRMILPADENAALPLDPGKEALD